MSGPALIFAPALELPGLRHAFFTRAGGVSKGIYASLNGGVGSQDAADARSVAVWTLMVLIPMFLASCAGFPFGQSGSLGGRRRLLALVQGGRCEQQHASDGSYLRDNRGEQHDRPVALLTVTMRRLTSPSRARGKR